MNLEIGKFYKKKNGTGKGIISCHTSLDSRENGKWIFGDQRSGQCSSVD